MKNKYSYKSHIKTINYFYISLIFLFSIFSFDVFAKNIRIKCIKLSSDERSKLIEACKKSCSSDFIVLGGYTLSFDYNMFGGTRARGHASKEYCMSERCEAEVDLFIAGHCDGYEINTKDLIKEIIENLPGKIVGKLYDPNVIYEY